MNRRVFIKMSVAAMATSVLPWDSVLGEEAKSMVWEVEGITDEKIKELFASIGGVQKLFNKDLSQATVLIKPNLCLPHPAASATTASPQVVDGLCAFLIANGIKKVIIADHTLIATNGFQNIEMIKVAGKYPQVSMFFANEQRLFQPTQINGKVLKSTEILKILQRVDLLINLATAKHHSAAMVSLAIKNLMGLIWDRSEFHTRLDMSQAIADLPLAIRPGLNIVDASRVLLNGGPTGPGPILNDNRLFASFDILALDALVVSRYNFGGRSLTPREIPHLWAAYKNGIGEIDTRKIKVEKI